MTTTSIGYPFITSSLDTSLPTVEILKTNNKQQDNTIDEHPTNDILETRLGIGITFNCIFLLIAISFIPNALLKINSIGYKEIKSGLFWCFIGFIIFIGSGLAEFLTYNKYNNIWAKNQDETYKKKKWDQALKYMSYINFAIGGILFMYILIATGKIYFYKNELLKRDSIFTTNIIQFANKLDKIYSLRGRNPTYIDDPREEFTSVSQNKKLESYLTLLDNYIKSINENL